MTSYVTKMNTNKSGYDSMIFWIVRKCDLTILDYSPMDFSRIYLNYEDFTNIKKKMSILRNNNEKKAKKK